MARMKAKQIKEMDEKARMQKIQELRTELRGLKTSSSTGYIDNPSRIRETRRTIARLMTVDRELRRSAKEKQ